ncbi:3-hydroxybutyryl-CoA dehydratase, partial [Candidatus Gracilibacteria bacterium]|nr:3-hydroxybutyryl-CoA dehydratase [Candidatus Gracilibacteria bacterium]
MPEYSELLLQIADNIATLTLNRPARLNALGVQLAAELRAALTELEANGAVRVLVLTGAGERAF